MPTLYEFLQAALSPTKGDPRRGWRIANVRAVPGTGHAPANSSRNRDRCWKKFRAHRWHERKAA